MYLASTKAHCDQTQLVALGEELGRDGRSVHGGDCSVIRSMNTCTWSAILNVILQMWEYIPQTPHTY